MQNLENFFRVLSSFFSIRNKHQKRSMRKLTVYLAKLLLQQVVIQKLGTKTAFVVPGSNKFKYQNWCGQPGGGLIV